MSRNDNPARWCTRLNATLALASAAVMLAGCGGGSKVAEPQAAPRSESALSASAPGELLGYVKGKLRERDKQRQDGQFLGYNDSIGAPIWLATVTTAGGTAERSGTSVQESGVDEDDLIKSDGNLIVTLTPERGERDAFAALRIYPVSASAKPDPISTLPLGISGNNYAVTHGMYLASEHKRVAVLAEASGGVIGFPDCAVGMACTSILPYPPSLKNQVELQLVDITDPAKATVRDRVTVDGRLVASRQIGRMLYLVTSHAPQFAVERLPATATASEREAALARLAASDFLPQWTLNGTSRPLLAETDCFVQAKNASLDLTVTTISAIDLASPTVAATHRCFVGGSEAVYMSPSNLYLATSRHQVQTLQSLRVFAPETRTDIHKFSVAGALISYRGTGQIEGHLGWDREKSPYRMSEHNGDLRVLSFTGQSGWAMPADAATKAVPASPATLTILRERATDQTLQAVSTLPNTQRPQAIGLAGEQVYAVRFLGERAYVVTFRQVDPLYVLDLSNPADPKTVGELKMPGFSDYLFPLDNGLLFGVGKDASDEGRLGGVKVALFDVRNAAQPRLLATQVFGERGSYSGLDSSRHALNMLARNGVARIALPMGIYTSSNARYQQGLQRFEVDTAAGTMTMKPMIEANASRGWVDLSTDRSLQIDSRLYYLTQGALTVSNW